MSIARELARFVTNTSAVDVPPPARGARLLVGNGMGALLARKAYVVASGERAPVRASRLD